MQTLFSAQLINLLSEKIVGCFFVLIGSSLLFISIIIFNLYLILIALCFFMDFLTANFVPLVIRQAVRQSTENILYNSWQFNNYGTYVQCLLLPQ